MVFFYSCFLAAHFVANTLSDAELMFRAVGDGEPDLIPMINRTNAFPRAFIDTGRRASYVEFGYDWLDFHGDADYCSSVHHNGIFMELADGSLKYNTRLINSPFWMEYTAHGCFPKTPWCFSYRDAIGISFENEEDMLAWVISV